MCERKKILNLYAGVGGNRKLWGDEYEITAVEYDENIAKIYSDLYPNDKIIVQDAHEYLRKHFREFDFIWASPPCPTHSVLQMTRYYDEKLKYPDMTLYQEIIWLQTFFRGKWVIENVKPYYPPLISPTFAIDRHYFWSSNFIMTNQIPAVKDFMQFKDDNKLMANALGFNINDLKTVDTRKVLRNCVVPEIGKYIFEKINL
jgi:DNA (cytosine-5)-methyltransferase 1